MFRPRVIPVLLLKDKGLVKTVQFDKHRYIGDPINAVRIFNDLETDELVFLDIMASKENRTISVEIVKQIGDEAFMPFAVGGGIKTCQDAINLINAGAEKIIVNTSFVKNPKLVTEIATLIGSQSMVVSIDVKKNWIGKYYAYINGGREKVSEQPIDLARKAEQLGAGEIIVNSIDNDGMMQGYDSNIIQQMAASVSIPIVACGGAGNLAHMRSVVDSGAHAAAAGSIFVYHGSRNAVLVNYPSKKDIKNNFI